MECIIWFSQYLSNIWWEKSDYSKNKWNIQTKNKNNPKTKHLNQSTATPSSYYCNLRYRAQNIAPQLSLPANNKQLYNNSNSSYRSKFNSSFSFTYNDFSHIIVLCTTNKNPKYNTILSTNFPHSDQFTKNNISPFSPDTLSSSSNPSYPFPTTFGI